MYFSMHNTDKEISNVKKEASPNAIEALSRKVDNSDAMQLLLMPCITTSGGRERGVRVALLIFPFVA